MRRIAQDTRHQAMKRDAAMLRRFRCSSDEADAAFTCSDDHPGRLDFLENRHGGARSDSP